MIAGFSGGLISHAYVEERVLSAIDRTQAAAFERHIVRWWQQASRSLGPASSTRAIFDVSVLPLLELLGHDRPAAAPLQTDCSRHCRQGACSSPFPGRNRLRAWRRAIGRGIASQATWAVIATAARSGSSIAFDRGRRAAIEFDFDALVAGPKGIAALVAGAPPHSPARSLFTSGPPPRIRCACVPGLPIAG